MRGAWSSRFSGLYASLLFSITCTGFFNPVYTVMKIWYLYLRRHAWSYGIADLLLGCCITIPTLLGNPFPGLDHFWQYRKKGLSVSLDYWPEVPAYLVINRALWHYMDRATGASLE